MNRCRMIALSCQSDTHEASSWGSRWRSVVGNCQSMRPRGKLVRDEVEERRE